MCRYYRSRHCSMGKKTIKESPSIGYCTSQGMYYYGFLQLYNQFMIIKNYAKDTDELFTRIFGNTDRFLFDFLVNLLADHILEFPKIHSF